MSTKQPKELIKALDDTRLALYRVSSMLTVLGELRGDHDRLDMMNYADTMKYLIRHSFETLDDAVTYIEAKEGLPAS